MRTTNGTDFRKSLGDSLRPEQKQPPCGRYATRAHFRPNWNRLSTISGSTAMEGHWPNIRLTRRLFGMGIRVRRLGEPGIPRGDRHGGLRFRQGAGTLMPAVTF